MTAAAPVASAQVPLRCAAFSPYVDGYDPATGPHPPAIIIDQLLDATVALGFSCIQTYGVLNGLDYTFEAARHRGLQVLANIWLDLANDVNQPSIAKGIEVALGYRDTSARISWGSEVRVRNGASAANPIILD